MAKSRNNFKEKAIGAVKKPGTINNYISNKLIDNDKINDRLW